MTTESFSTCEKRSAIQIKKYQLPNHFKKIGIAITVSAFVAMFINKFTFDDHAYRLVCKYGLLVGLLLVSISKEKIEDEFIVKMRMESYTFAFVVGVAYAIVLPFIDFLVDVFITGKEAILKDMGDFEILWILLCVQVLCFEYIKRVNQ